MEDVAESETSLVVMQRWTAVAKELRLRRRCCIRLLRLPSLAAGHGCRFACLVAQDESQAQILATQTLSSLTNTLLGLRLSEAASSVSYQSLTLQTFLPRSLALRLRHQKQPSCYEQCLWGCSLRQIHRSQGQG